MSRRLSVIDLTSASVPAPAPAPTSTSTSTSTHRQLSSDITSVDSFSDSLEEQPTPNLRNHTVPRGAKRRRDGEELGHAGPSSRPRLDHPIDPRIEGPIQAIDLTEVDSSSELAKTLSSLREDAVKSQQPHGDEANSARSVLGSYKCPICMDTPEDATSTACGMFIDDPAGNALNIAEPICPSVLY
ncbi:hypothetical protein N7509_002687 [Penicillium cosmopolitanum]|uniref:Uncharacterized protein n=1 Tax=Penicillium cosmopolitanum TaxID=1131564 RepID=A0A9W9W9I8_9EURO|nr:uncharacterized protein N7509_002687 [Penicillium cosmopolitanum]KAJ5408804.1 hypothetical protein N7509_002687 [Penicillium cosmopolitanum]